MWWPEKGPFPNFTEKKYLKAFKGMPMFIFHGKADRNCPFDITEQIIDKINKIVADVTFVFEEDKGHEPPDQSTVEKFEQWVQQIIEN